jgi:hypothetical protein
MSPVQLQQRHTSAGQKSLRNDLSVRIAVLAGNRSRSFRLRLRLRKFFGCIECLESARRHRRAGKISHQINPEIRPGRQPENGHTHRDRWVERSAGNAADGKRSRQHRESDRQPIKRVARCALGRSDVQHDLNQRKGEKKLCHKRGYSRWLERCNSGPSL